MISWSATAFLILATIVRAFDISHNLDLILTLLGCSLWAYEGFVMKNKSLIAVNLFGSGIIIAGFAKSLLF